MEVEIKCIMFQIQLMWPPGFGNVFDTYIVKSKVGVGTVLDHVDVDDCSHKFGTTACGYIKLKCYYFQPIILSKKFPSF